MDTPWIIINFSELLRLFISVAIGVWSYVRR